MLSPDGTFPSGGDDAHRNNCSPRNAGHRGLPLRGDYELTDNRSRRLGYYLPKPEGTMDGKVMGKALDDECMAEFDVISKPVLDLVPILWASKPQIYRIVRSE